MTQDLDTAEWALSPWAGTIEMVIRGASIAVERIAEAAPFPSGYDKATAFNAELDEAQHRAESARVASIEIVEDGGFRRKLNAIDDLAELLADHLGRVESMSVEIGGYGFNQPRAEVRLSRARGVEVKVVGKSRNWTAGLRHELQDALTPVQRVGLPRRLKDVVGSVGIVLSGGLVIGFVTSLVGDASVGARVALGLAVLLDALVLLIGWKLPSFELLRPGQTPAYQVWKRRIAGAVVALVIGIAASIAATALE
jgi:hypothetical protein